MNKKVSISNHEHYLYNYLSMILNVILKKETKKNKRDNETRQEFTTESSYRLNNIPHMPYHINASTQ